MPAVVDPQQRRRLVVEAAFQLVVREGLAAVSLRRVAAQAGLNLGSVRHYFDGSGDLLDAAAQEAGRRMEQRLAHCPPEQLRGLRGEAAVEGLLRLLEAVLPLDRGRRDEAIVVLEFIVASRVRPELREVSRRMGRDLREVLEAALHELGVADPAAGVLQLSAVIGGVTLDAITPHGALDAEAIRAVLRAQVRGIVGERG